MKRLMLLSLLVLSTGCSLDASLQQLEKWKLTLGSLDDVKITGLTTGSSQKGMTANGAYFIQSSVGAPMSNMTQTTSDGSYVIYSSVQSAIIPR